MYVKWTESDLTGEESTEVCWINSHHLNVKFIPLHCVCARTGEKRGSELLETHNANTPITPHHHHYVTYSQPDLLPHGTASFTA